MKHTLTAIAAAALITLTGCGNGETEAETQPNIEPAESSPTLKVATESEGWPLEPNPNGHEIHIMFQWVPEADDPQPVDATYFMQTSEEGMGYSTGMDDDIMPSVDSGQYESFVYEVPDGGNASGTAYVNRSPTDGYSACLIVEARQNVVLDYQESEPGEDNVACYGFTDDNHDYTPGTPPEGVIP